MRTISYEQQQQQLRKFVISTNLIYCTLSLHFSSLFHKRVIDSSHTSTQIISRNGFRWDSDIRRIMVQATYTRTMKSRIEF